MLSYYIISQLALMNWITNLFQKPQPQPNLATPSQLHQQMIKLAQHHRTRSHTKFYKQVKLAMVENKSQSLLLPKMKQFVSFLNKNGAIANYTNHKYIRNVFESQFKQGFLSMILAKWVSCIVKNYDLEITVIKQNYDIVMGNHNKTQKKYANPLTKISVEGSYNFLKQQIYLLTQFIWKIGLTVFKQFLESDRKSQQQACQMDETFMQYIAHLIVCNKRLKPIYKIFVQYEKIFTSEDTKQEHLTAQHQREIKELAQQKFAQFIKKQVKLELPYKEIFPRTISLLIKFQDQHRIEEKIDLITKFQKQIKYEIGLAQELTLKVKLQYKKQSITDRILGYLLLLHHRHIFIDIKYLDLIMFADKKDILESGFPNISEYENEFKIYCQYYTTGLPNIDRCYAGIMLLKNSINQMHRREQKFIKVVINKQPYKSDSESGVDENYVEK